MTLLKLPQAKITEDGEVKPYKGGFVYFKPDIVVGCYNAIDRFECVVKGAFTVNTEHGQFLVAGDLESFVKELEAYIA